MIIKRIKLTDILVLLGKDVIRVDGEQKDIYIDNLADLANVNETTLDWVLPIKTNKQQIVEGTKARVVLVDEEVVYTEVMQQANKTLIVVKSPKFALAKIGNHFFMERPTAGIHPTAVVHPEAVIGKNVSIGAYAVIGKATIGDDCIIDSNVRIYDGVMIGKCCDIKAGAILGGAGFGFEKDENGNKFRFPQIGGVVMGDYVEVGGNTCIDRGALSDTVIGDYTKINNLCHIAHNNKIGRNVTITGCVNVSGSNVIDDNVWIAPNASVRGFIHLGEGCTLGMGAVATKNIPAGETWVGNPARKMEKNNCL